MIEIEMNKHDIKNTRQDGSQIKYHDKVRIITESIKDHTSKDPKTGITM